MLDAVDGLGQSRSLLSPCPLSRGKISTDLQENGVEVLFDKWHLKEGDDKFAFMEKCVTDPTVDKVILISDRLYAEKADGREGGVGHETQIISPEVYEKTDESRVIPIVTEKSEATGEPFLPAYLKARIYVDMTDASEFEARLEQVIRRIYGRPEHVPPPLGKPPSYITEDATVRLGTNSRFQRVKSAIERGEATARGALADYVETFIRELDRLAIEPDEGEPQPAPSLAAWFKSIEDFKPYRDQFLDMVDVLCKYQDDVPTDQLHGFLESFLVCCYRPVGRTTWQPHFRENFQFMAHELLLHLVALLIHRERFAEIDELLSDFLLPEGSLNVRSDDAIAPFTEFRRHYQTLEVWNQEQARESDRRWLSPAGYWLKARASHPHVDFNRLMEADFVLFLRADLLDLDERWWPVSLVYVGFHPTPFRLFLRARSARYFDKMKVALGCQSVDQLAALGQQYRDPDNKVRTVPRWEGDVADPVALADLANLATKP